MGEKIKTLRTAAGLTQKELARRLEYDEDTIYRWEHGRQIPRISSIQALCEVLGVDMNEFVKDLRGK